MSGNLNTMRREAERVAAQIALKRAAIVTAYDPAVYAAKVRIQPEDTETGWLPIASPWVGDGWGLFAAPKVGDVVEVSFQEGGKAAGIVGLRHYGNVLRPLPVPSGEFWLQHESGSFLKFKNDGSVEVHAAGDLNATVAGQANLAVTGNVVATAPLFDLTGDVKVTGDVLVTGDIFDLNGLYGSFGYLRQTYNIHTHPISGGSTTQPNQQV
ncbi:phage baseplate assembly protein V [Gemmata sp. JC717]|uniref:phage baseplate assembly protein V n=1 Tax=Gemmata algarum TaxID=2975278 RepID=UPI0021BBB2C0|nr:phage baseplate assembly protein V [Gemmata algarum]MDY3551397.1 phage baseplate assembly protein V [Gemmata algarum]